MQKIFKRSRTPTGAEMKTQSSLEVPKQVRSASFDEIQLEAKRNQYLDPKALLKVPPNSGQRSKSFDSSQNQSEADPGTFLEVPTRTLFQRRRSSGDKMTALCVHCACVEEYNRIQSRQSSGDEVLSLRSFSYSDSSATSEDFDSFDYEQTEESEPPDIDIPSPCITVTLSPVPPCTPTFDIISFGGDDILATTTSARRRSVTSPKLERQQAFIFPESLETQNSSETTYTTSESDSTNQVFNLATDFNAFSFTDKTAITKTSSSSCENNENPVIVSEFFLTVPDLKRDRAASMDSCFINKQPPSGKPEEVVPIPSSQLLEPPSSSTLRSRSVDIVLPTDQQARYRALSCQHDASCQQHLQEPVRLAPVPTRGKAVQGDGSDGTSRQIRQTPDWGDSALNGDHLWVPTNASGDMCYVADADCTKHGPRMRCPSCKIVAHSSCISILLDKVKFTCKPSFRDVGVRQYREHTCIHHHWVHRRSQKGKCKQCSKSFQSKLSFSSKEIVALSCSWCKTAYHNKETCFNVQKIGEECNLGTHNSIIVPPSWIVKLPRRGSFKSSLRKSPKKKNSSKKRSKEKNENSQKTFVIKPIPSTNIKPLIVFINPKSGGNQGAKLLQKFQWLLNPRQVFDLTQGGPKMGIELFRKVPNLRILACGGDGTVGWVLSVLDQMGFVPPPAVGVLPLGTGNDLARALGWGGGYTDEPISKILEDLGESDIAYLDRWDLKVEKNPNAEPNEEGKENLPLNVLNNYFSLGVDAHIALEFHEAREAHPERFNSRLRNKMFYGQMGGKDLLRRKWKGLADVVTLECDGKDMTPKLKEHRVHAIVFLNIPSYSGGTHPWSGTDQKTDDGLIEVVGLTTYHLPLLQAGGHGISIAQCKSAKIVTSKTIPMQVDGEACKVNPSIIMINLLNKAPMLTKRKGSKTTVQPTTLEPMKLSVQKISMYDYETNHYDKNLLRQKATCLGEIEVSPVIDLEQVRKMVNKLQEDLKPVQDGGGSGSEPAKLSPDWVFVDSITAERFFRIDRAQEHLHFVMDITSDTLFILDTLPPTPDDDPAFPSPATPSPGELNTPDISNILEKTSEGVLKAARVGDIKMLKDLHSQSYSLLSIDSLGQTALHYGSRYGHKDIVKYIIACAPASILNMQDNDKGQTALHKAAMFKRRSICCMLVAGGASLTVKDYDGNTPRNLAILASDTELAAYLESQEHFQLVSQDVETIV
uniref:Diacylglycerol kinase n=1 Tax=Cacopsylla melanoneura TaxID=428564 RepID=A0A8D8M3J0_9HEMI